MMKVKIVKEVKRSDGLFNIAADAIRPKTDFTLETNRKNVKEKLLKSIQNPAFYLLDLEFQTIEIQSFWAKSNKIQMPRW